jgi:pimeloyl-ACP methyl ester carboxylesterase
MVEPKNLLPVMTSGQWPMTFGHDRGARVATRFAKDHPAMLDQFVVMDNIPTRIIFQRMNAEVARGHWFFIFNNVPDLPERSLAEERKDGSVTSFLVGAIIRSSSRAKKSRNMCGLILSLEPCAELLMITALVLKTSSRMKRMKEF